MKISFVNSDDRFERVYNKKGYRLSLLIDNSPGFKLSLDNFISSTFRQDILEMYRKEIDYLLGLDKTLIRMCLLDFKILERWMNNNNVKDFA